MSDTLTASEAAEVASLIAYLEAEKVALHEARRRAPNGIEAARLAREWLAVNAEQSAWHDYLLDTPVEG